MWYTLIVALEAYLTNVAAFSNVVIQLGDCADVHESTTLVLLRGKTQPDNLVRHIRGKQTLHIECWVHSAEREAEQQTHDAYSQLAALENDLTTALQAFGHEPNTVSGYHIRVELTPFEPDGDQFHPSVASRITIDIIYNKINP